MLGRNTLNLNIATLAEAIEEYLNCRLYACNAVKVTDVRWADDELRVTFEPKPQETTKGDEDD